MKKSHFWWFFGWDWGTPAILRQNSNKITVLYGCGFGFKTLGLGQTPAPSLGQNPNFYRFLWRLPLEQFYIFPSRDEFESRISSKLRLSLFPSFPFPANRRGSIRRRWKSRSQRSRILRLQAWQVCHGRWKVWWWWWWWSMFWMMAKHKWMGRKSKWKNKYNQELVLADAMHCRLFLVSALVQFPFAMTEAKWFLINVYLLRLRDETQWNKNKTRAAEELFAWEWILNNWRLTENFQTQHINAQVKAKRWKSANMLS